MNPYRKFCLMFTCSFVLMYAAMFTNVDDADHILLSYTRAYMTFLMIAPMAIVMLLFMWQMYKNKTLNYIIITVFTVAFSVFYYALRNQAFISDVEYMKAMIPHHSSAVMTSRKATLRDPETQELARGIIASQEREIEQMKKIISRLEKKHTDN